MDITKIEFERIYNFKKQQGAALSLNQDIVVYDDEYVNEKSIFDIETMSPIRVDTKTYFLCVDGEMSINLNYKKYRLKRGSILNLNGRHIIDNIQVKDNYRGYVLIFSTDFILSIFKWIPELRELTVNADQQIPLMELDEAELVKYIDIIERIKNKLRSSDHIFYSHVIRLEAINFILDLAESFSKRYANQDTNILSSKGAETFEHFIALVVEHCKSQHQASFYAAELLMTPVSFSRAIKNVSGKSPIKWINRALIAEAKILLHNPDISVQQVAFDLNFADQSSFGKFFKKHTGKSPLLYKENIKKSQLF